MQHTNIFTQYMFVIHKSMHTFDYKQNYISFIVGIILMTLQLYISALKIFKTEKLKYGMA